jgi:hypothetical protein
VSGVSEPDEDRVVFMEDVVGGEQDQAAGGLGVEKHEAGRDPSTDRSGGLVQESAEEFQAPVLGRATAFDLVQSRQHEVLWGAARVDGPVEEGAEGALLVLVMAGVPVVDVGLGEVGESALVVDESGQELVGAGELLECVVAGAVGQGPRAARARSLGSWCQVAKCSRSWRCGSPSSSARRRCSQLSNRRSLPSRSGSSPQAMRRSRR